MGLRLVEIHISFLENIGMLHIYHYSTVLGKGGTLISVLIFTSEQFSANLAEACALSGDSGIMLMTNDNLYDF